MLVKDLPFENLPQVKLSDKVHNVLNKMYQYYVHELPVVEQDNFLGLIKEEVLLNEDEDHSLTQLKNSLLKISVNPDDHLLRAISIATASNLSVIPVSTREDKFMGAIESAHLLKDVADFMHLDEPGALIVLELEPRSYSFSEISKIVETNDAQITQLNSFVNKLTGLMQVTIRINKIEVSDIVSTFQRYEYNVKYYFGEEFYANELKNNYENLMNYLNI